MWALHTCGWKTLPWWLLWPEHSSEVRSGSIHRDSKIGRGEVKVEEVEIIALFRERNMRKLQSIHSYRQMVSCPRRKKIISVFQERYTLWNIHSAQVISGIRVEKIIHRFFSLQKARMWMASVCIHLNCYHKPGTSCSPLWWGFVCTPHVSNTMSTVLRLLTLRSSLSFEGT